MVGFTQSRKTDISHPTLWFGVTVQELAVDKISWPPGVTRQVYFGARTCWRNKLVSSEVETRVIEIVCEQLDIQNHEVSRRSAFMDDLKADSLDVVELVMALEDEFDIKIPDEDYDKIMTVGNAIDYIVEKSGG